MLMRTSGEVLVDHDTARRLELEQKAAGIEPGQWRTQQKGKGTTAQKSQQNGQSRDAGWWEGLGFYIYFVTILQKYMVRYKFSKNVHLPPWATASGTKRRGPRR
jgi:hypothetical protein